MWIETERADPSQTPTDVMVLLLRPAERLPDNKARVDGEPVRVAISLSTGRCTPLDEQADRLLEHRNWFAGAVLEYLDRLRERAHRIGAQSDREWSFRSAFKYREPGAMMPYERIFPADFQPFRRDIAAVAWLLMSSSVAVTLCAVATFTFVGTLHDIYSAVINDHVALNATFVFFLWVLSPLSGMPLLVFLHAAVKASPD